jgi:hypothetical protein
MFLGSSFFFFEKVRRRIKFLNPCRTRHRGGPQNNSILVEKELVSGTMFF